ncbi:hypothetical protein [Streptomyces sp. cmx-4-9]|uniref:hypothetical protein n=1 Tax=Streptomyces sp. cmx-4-9 TaxID=2790941 RepID=UPI00397F0B02
MTPAHETCDACEIYQKAIAGILADWNAAGSPTGPGPYRDQIGLALAMYTAHQDEHQNA